MTYSKEDVAKVQVKYTNYAMVGPGIGLLVVGAIILIVCAVYFGRQQGGGLQGNAKKGGLLFGIIAGVMSIIGGIVLCVLGAEAKRALKSSEVDDAVAQAQEDAAASAAP